MNERLPRRLVHQGTVKAAGLFLDGALYGEREARRRILSLWEPGTRIARVRDGWLVLLPHPRAVDGGTAPGLPLVGQGQALVGAPLSPRETKSLAPAPEEILFLHAGRWVREPLRGGKPEDPAAWLDVEGFAAVATASLGAPPALPKAAPEPAIPEVDLRTRLEGIPVPDPELAEVIERLRKGKRATPRRRLSLGEALRYGADFVRYGLAGLSSLLARHGGGPAAPAGESPSPKELSRWGAAMRRFFSRLVLSSPLARAVGRRYALYIQRMIDMFESGDIQSALRHAIPLDSGLAQAPPAFSLAPPRPRDSLSISPGMAPARSAVPFDLYSDLKQIYRRAFERLEAQGRIQEAAFLLAEILQAHEEAVAFLEKYGHLKLAAEMAEARKLPPGLVVRQWFLAGDRQRALRIARRTGAFGDAVSRLERSGRKEEAELFRMLWASGLAEAGDYAAAVDAAWPVPAARRLSLGWIDRAIDQGGAVAGRMLARKILVAPGPFAPLRDAALELLENRDAERIAARRAFAETLVQGSRTPEAQVLARAAVRAIVRDANVSTVHRLSPSDLRKLTDFAADGPLRTDVPALAMPSQQSWMAENGGLRIEIPSWDVGALPLHDAAFLPSGRLAVALGEAGVRLLTRAGHTAAEFDQPAHRLVVSDHGDRAIAMARRGEIWKLSRLDFAARRAEPWTDARIDVFAGDYDGALWFVAGPDGFVAVDAASPRFDGPWGLSDLPGPILSVVRSKSHLSLLISGREDLQVWTYDLPLLALRSREPVPETEVAVIGQAISPRGELTRLWLEAEDDEDDPQPPQLHLQVPGTETPRFTFGLTPPFRLEAPQIAGDWIAVPIYEREGLTLYVAHRSRRALGATIILARTTQAALRLTPDTLTVADELGRLLVIDLAHGQVIRNLRL